MMTVIKQGKCGYHSVIAAKGFRVLQEAGVKVYLTRHQMPGGAAIIPDGKLQEASNANVEGHWT